MKVKLLHCKKIPVNFYFHFSENWSEEIRHFAYGVNLELKKKKNVMWKYLDMILMFFQVQKIFYHSIKIIENLSVLFLLI